MKKMIVLIVLTAVILSLIVWFLIPYSPLRSAFEKDIKELESTCDLYGDGDVLTSDDIKDLPAPVRNYLESCGYIGKRKMDFVKMEYRDVAFSQGRQGPELTIDYTQYDIAAVPCRMALIESSMFGIPFQGYDSYRDGKGGMKGVIAKLITLFDQKGKEMDRACLATYLAESMFIPTALLQDCMEFEEIDDFHVKASISAYGDKVSGIFTFNEDHEMVSFTTEDRAVVASDGTIEYVPWEARCGDYKTGPDGIRIPGTFQAVWNYPDGDFIYFDGKISSITYDKLQEEKA